MGLFAESRHPTLGKWIIGCLLLCFVAGTFIAASPQSARAQEEEKKEEPGKGTKISGRIPLGD